MHSEISMPGFCRVTVRQLADRSRTRKGWRPAYFWIAVAGLALLAALPSTAQTARYVGTQTPLSSGLNNPRGMAVDSSNNFYFADTGNSRILKETPNGSGYAETVITDSLVTSPVAIAVDAAGDLFVLNSNPGSLVELAYSNGTYTSSTILSSLPYGSGVAVTADGTELLATSTPINTSDPSIYQFLSTSQDPGCGKIKTCPSYFEETRVTSGVSGPTAIAFDAHNNWYVLSGTTGTVTVHSEALSGAEYSGTTLYTVDTSTFGLYGINGLSVDPAGDLYIATGTNYLLEAVLTGATPAGITYSTRVVLSNLPYMSGLAVDSNGVMAVSSVTATSALVQNPAAPNFGSVPIGSASAAQTLAFVFDAPTSSYGLATTQSLLGGVGNLDYAVVAGSGTTCTAGSTFHGYATCTVTATFTPAYPGPRNGAIMLREQVLSTTGLSDVDIATAYITGTGSGPQIAFPPVQTALGSGLSEPTGVAVDGAGNVYITDTDNSRVIEEVYANGGYTQSPTAIGSGLLEPKGLAVDGAGNLYVSDFGNNRVVEEVYANGGYTQKATTIGSGLSEPAGLAVDGAGNLYIADYGNNRVVQEVYANGGYSQSATAIGSGLSKPTGLAVDGAGNLYIADYGNNRVVQEIYANGVYTQSATAIGSGLSKPTDVAVDGAGNLYIADFGNSRVVQEVYTNGVYTQSATAIGSGLTSPKRLAVDGAGNVYIADAGNNLAYVESVTTPPSLTFASTAVGTTSSDSPQTVAISNTGNQPLVFASVTSTKDFPAKVGDCTGSPLAAGASCSLVYIYAPVSIILKDSIDQPSTLTDNTLNGTNTQQVITLTGGTPKLGEQTITFPQPASSTYPGSVTLAATASSGLSVSYTVEGPATLSGSTLTYTGPGTVQVTASQAGIVYVYAAATPVSISISVRELAAPLVWQPSTVNLYAGTPLGNGILDASDATAGTITYSAASTPSGASNAVTATTALTQGTYELTATFNPADPGTYLGASQSEQLTVQNMNVFVANSNGTVTSFYDYGTQQSAAANGGGLGAAVDSSGNVWSINHNGDGISEFSDAGVQIGSYSGGILSGAALTVDGNGTVWVASGFGSVSALTPAGLAALNGPIGTAANLKNPASINVDSAGSLWLANSGNNTVTEIIGVAAPVTTPLAQSVVNSVIRIIVPPPNLPIFQGSVVNNTVGVHQ